MIELTNIDIWSITFSFILIVVSFFQILNLTIKKDYTCLLLWPILIYLIGPLMTSLFSNHPVLSRYVDSNRSNILTFQMFWYFELTIFFSYVFKLSNCLKVNLSGRTLFYLSSSQLFPIIFYFSILFSSILQIHLISTVGSIFTGSYVLENLEEYGISYWGFLAGLYEITFISFILLLIGQKPTKKNWYLYIFFYVFTTFLRLLGGTRLVIVKEIIFIILLLYLKNSLSLKRLFIIVFGVLFLGTLIGLLRGGSGDPLADILGPLYGLIMESALNALTLSIADIVNQSGFVSSNGNLFYSIIFFSINMIPSFLRFGLSDTFINSFNPANMALDYGFDTIAPVGGMSGFATINYLTSYPFVFLFLHDC